MWVIQGQKTFEIDPERKPTFLDRLDPICGDVEFVLNQNSYLSSILLLADPAEIAVRSVKTNGDDASKIV